MITDDEVRALTGYIVNLETQIGWLESKRLLYTQGPLALVAKAALVEPPPACEIGNAGHIVLSDHTRIYGHL